jgi:hypothetical protein
VSAAGKERVVAIFLMFDRELSDPRVDGNSLKVFFRADESFKFSVVQGAEAAAADAIPPALRADAILLADVIRRFEQTPRGRTVARTRPRPSKRRSTRSSATSAANGARKVGAAATAAHPARSARRIV